MKRTLIFVALCALTLVNKSSLAQKGFDLGINAGLQTTTLINKTDQAAGPQLDFTQKVNVPFGVSAGYSFSHHLGLEVDAIYSQQGQYYNGIVKPDNDPDMVLYQINRLATLNNITLQGSYTAQVALNCLKVPVLFRYTGDTRRRAYFHSFIGPQVNLLQSAGFRINDQDVSVEGLNIKPADLYNRMTIDAVLGVGGGINLTKHLNITADLRLEYGMGSVEKNGATYTDMSDVTTKYYGAGRKPNHSATGGLLVGVHYRFEKKKEQKIAYRTRKLAK